VATPTVSRSAPHSEEPPSSGAGSSAHQAKAIRTKRGIDAFGGNMPFLGGRRIATQHGDRYAEWLTQMYGGTGDTDYVGYFFHRAAELMTPSGSLGFIATNAIADGDNRRTVLGRLVSGPTPFHIHTATTGTPWPGNAQVLVSTLFLERGLPEQVTRPRLLDRRPVAAINSRLRAGNEWPEPEPLAENAGLALVGCFLRGEGFVLEPAEAQAFLGAHPAEGEVIRPFLVGDDLNNTIDQSARRFVIDFGDMSFDEAKRFPHALAILDERVRPSRERLKTTGADAEHRKYWWRFASVRKELRERAAAMPRLLATARVAKHSMFAFIPHGCTPSDQVVLFPLVSWTAFAVLQSRIHGVWVSLQATHMGEGIRYSAGDCFAPFPFPAGRPETMLPALEIAGERLHVGRTRFMRQRGLGLTQTYNLLTESMVSDPAVPELRALHESVDRAVLDAYGWPDVALPSPDQPSEIRDFEDMVADRLFALNAERAVPGAGSTRPQRPGPEVRKTKATRGPSTVSARRQALEPAKRRAR
jgi:hypothetical protein